MTLVQCLRRRTNGLKQLFSIILIGAVCTTGYASTGPKNAVVNIGTLIDAQDMGANRSFSQTQLSNMGAFGLLNVYLSLTDANNSVTNIRMTCTASLDGNTTDFTMQSCTVASGVCTSDNAAWDRNPSAVASPKRWVWRVDIEGLEDIECTFAPTGGAAADLLTVTGQLAVKGS